MSSNLILEYIVTMSVSGLYRKCDPQNGAQILELIDKVFCGFYMFHYNIHIFINHYQYI